MNEYSRQSKAFRGLLLSILLLLFAVSLPCVSMSAENCVRYDGVYVSERQTAGNTDYWEYLRFFPDDVVVTVSSTGRPEAVIKWLTKDHRGTSFSKVVMQEGAMLFPNRGVNVEYICKLINDRLHIQSFSRATQKQFNHDYIFIPAEQAASFAMPDAARVSVDGEKGEADGTNQRVSQVLGDFNGSFEDMVPKLAGGTEPEQKLTVTCNAAGGCVVKIGDGPVDSFEKVTTTQSLKYAEDALSYAKDHRHVDAASTMSWSAKHLQPLLDSQAKIESCMDLSGAATKGMPELPAGSPAYFLLCKVDHNPWDRPAILFLSMSMAKCQGLFCGYEITPVFRKTNVTP